MSPFTEEVSLEIRRNSGWKCDSCGKSSFEPEKWLLDASHINHERNEEYNSPENGQTHCRICHLMEHIDLGDIAGVERIAERIWNSGLRHMSEYQRDFGLLIEERIQLSELLTATGFTGRIHIDEKVHSYSEMTQYINSRRRKKK